MARKTYTSKFDLYKMVQRLRDDPEPPISYIMLCELAGVSKSQMDNVFVRNSAVMSEMVQIRLSRAFEKLANGEVLVVKHRNQTKEVRYQKEPKPRMRRSMGLTLENGQVKLKVGIRNRGDYTQPTFKDQMDGD